MTILPAPQDPADGMVGYMTWKDFDRLRWAVTNALKHVAWWRVAGHIRSGDPDEGRRHQKRSTSAPLPLPAPWLAAHEITRLLEELNRFPDLEDAANDMEGYALARLLIREVETACAKWPIDDRPHRVRFFRCLACDRQSLKYFPPKVGNREGISRVEVAYRIADGTVTTVDLMNTTVRCTEKDCGAVLDETMWRRAVAMVEAEWEARHARAR